MIVGTHECKADSKGRVMIPSALKKQLGGDEIHQHKFIIKRSVFNNCLELHPISAWKEIMSQINKLNRFLKKNNDFIRSYMAGLKELEIDRSGRFLIPRNLCVFSGINKNIVLSSSVSMIEIWDKKQYEESVKESLINFSTLAEDVMGGQSKDKNDLS